MTTSGWYWIGDPGGAETPPCTLPRQIPAAASAFPVMVGIRGGNWNVSPSESVVAGTEYTSVEARLCSEMASAVQAGPEVASDGW